MNSKIEGHRLRLLRFEKDRKQAFASFSRCAKPRPTNFANSKILVEGLSHRDIENIQDYENPGYFLWSRGADKTPTFELFLEELNNIKIAVNKLSNISMYDDKKLLKIKL